MKPQISGLVFCAVLLLTVLFSQVFVDVLNRHEQSRLQHGEITCEEPSSLKNSSLKLTGNSTSNLVSILNETAKVAVVFDVKYNYVALFYGRTGNVVFVDLKYKNGLFFTGDSSHISWVSQFQSFEEFFKSVPSLRLILKSDGANSEKFTVENVKPGISLEIKLALIALSRNEYYIIQDRALTEFIEDTTILVEILKGPLDGVLKIWKGDARTLKVSVKSVILVIQTLSRICNVTVLEELNLDWNFVLNPKSFSQTFIYLFSKLSEHSIVVKPIVHNYVKDFSVLLVSLAGNSTVGAIGALRVTAEVRGGIVSISGSDSLIYILLHYYTHLGNNCATFDNFLKEMKEVEDFLEESRIAGELQNHTTAFMRGIQKGSVSDHGVNVSQISRILFDTDTVPLQNIVKILSMVKTVFNLETSVGILLYHLIELILDRNIGEVRNLVPSLKTDISVDFLSYILCGAQVNDFNDDLYKFLRDRPVIGQIFEIVDSSLKSCNEENLRSMFKSKYFSQYRRLVTKMLEKVVEEVKNECEQKEGSEEETSKYLNSPYHGTSRRLLRINYKQVKREDLEHAKQQSNIDIRKNERT